MRIVVGFLTSPEGQAALVRAREEAALRNAELLVIHSMRGGERNELEKVMNYREAFEELEAELARSGIAYRLVEYARGNAPADDVLQAAKEEDADLIVIGIRRRSPVGKLILGSNAQDILLNAECAVLAVKAGSDED